MTFEPSDCGPPIPVASGIRYLPYGPITGLERGTMPLLESTSYDFQYHQRVHEVTAGGARVLRLEQGYDLAGNVLWGADSRDPGVPWSYGVDELGRLTSAAGAYGDSSSIAYGYDDVGNRLTRALAGGSTTRDEVYGYAGPLLDFVDVSVDGGAPARVEVTSDPVGNVVAVGGDTLGYSSRNLLGLVDTGEDGRTFGYGPEGWLTTMGSASGDTHFLRTPDGQPAFVDHPAYEISGAGFEHLTMLGWGRVTSRRRPS